MSDVHLLIVSKTAIRRGVRRQYRGIFKTFSNHIALFKQVLTLLREARFTLKLQNV